MSDKQVFEFEIWYDIFIDGVRSLGYKGSIDRDSAKADYDNGLTPEYAAGSLVDELRQYLEP
jgi:hypothetical protein